MPAEITTTAVAARLGCSRQAVRNAVQRGDLNARKVGPLWLVADDATLAAYVVPERGGRTHAGYRSPAGTTADS